MFETRKVYKTYEQIVLHRRVAVHAYGHQGEYPPMQRCSPFKVAILRGAH